jgi:hypothetical protein
MTATRRVFSILCVALVLATAGLLPARVQRPAQPAAPVPVKFTRLIDRSPSPDDPHYDVDFDYAFPDVAQLEISGVGPVPSEGTGRFATRDPAIQFTDAATGTVVASYDLKNQLASMRAEIAGLGGSPVERLRRNELLLAVGDDQSAITDLALLSSSGSLSTSTRNLASLQLGRAFAASGDTGAALKQYHRVSASGRSGFQQEAFFRTGDLELTQGNSAAADRANSASLASTTASSGYYVREARSTQVFFASLRTVQPSSGPGPLVRNIGTPIAEEVPDKAFAEYKRRQWAKVTTHPPSVARLWFLLFKTRPNIYPRPPGVKYCSATGYYYLGTSQINGLFGRVAFRVTRWYPSDLGPVPNTYKIEYAAQQEPTGMDGLPNAWSPMADTTMITIRNSMLADFERQLASLEQTS